jgi:hypothetical protein
MMQNQGREKLPHYGGGYMNKKYYRFFGPFLEAQENWLNAKAAQGYRLVRISSIAYEFQPCEKGKYHYAVEFAGEKSYKELMEYKAFLESCGYRTFTKSIQLNYPFGKVRWRPWAAGGGKFATSPGAFNKELLILEKENDGTEFALRTNWHDRIEYARTLRNMYLTILLFGLLITALAVWGYWRGESSLYLAAIFGCFSLIFTVPVLTYSFKIQKLRKAAMLHE